MANNETSKLATKACNIEEPLEYHQFLRADHFKAIKFDPANASVYSSNCGILIASVAEWTRTIPRCCQMVSTSSVRAPEGRIQVSPCLLTRNVKNSPRQLLRLIHKNPRGVIIRSEFQNKLPIFAIVRASKNAFSTFVKAIGIS